MENLKEKQLEEAYSTAKNYPNLVQNLKKIEVKGYVFEVASQICIYRYADGTSHIKSHGDTRSLHVSATYNAENVKLAISNNQKGLTDFPTFLKEIADAGIKTYDADFDEMIVSYYGTRDLHVEVIPE